MFLSYPISISLRKMNIKTNSVGLRILWSEIRDLLWRISKKVSSMGNRIANRSEPSVLFIYYENSIAESQLYPFFENRLEIKTKHGLDFYMHPISRRKELISEDTYNPRVILIQVHFHSTKQFIERLFLDLKKKWPSTRIILMDWYATSDLRLADSVNSSIDLYVKKTSFADFENYRRYYFGDTNLMDYFGKMYDCDHEEKRYIIPDGFKTKLINGPGFLTAPYLCSLFSYRAQPNGHKPIDLNARFSTRGSQWYSSMRISALSVAKSLPNKYQVVTGSLNKRRYLAELSLCKVTISPFGYGEICWRDYEAIAMGSLLFKPDMGHLSAVPDIYRPYETYIPIAWDYSDFDEKFSYYLERPDEIERIIGNAYRVCHEYLNKQAFLTHLETLLSDQTETNII